MELCWGCMGLFVVKKYFWIPRAVQVLWCLVVISMIQRVDRYRRLKLALLSSDLNPELSHSWSEWGVALSVVHEDDCVVRNFLVNAIATWNWITSVVPIILKFQLQHAVQSFREGNYHCKFDHSVKDNDIPIFKVLHSEYDALFLLILSKPSMSFFGQS